MRFGAVDIDTADGMSLARDSGALEQGIPCVRAFVKKSGSPQGTLVWAGDGTPSLAELTAKFHAVVPAVKSGDRLRKQM